MLIRIYSVHDVKAETYSQPFFAGQDGQATRQFSDLINDDKHPFGKHPHDYTIFFIGTFDDQTAETTQITPISLGNGVEYINQSPPT